MTRIVHLTSVHPRHDTRIFLKQCRSLTDAGYDVTLVVADGLGNKHHDGVEIIDVGKANGRINRMLKTTRRVKECALGLDAEVFHLHDPELLPVGLSLKRQGKCVIFDSHEDVPRQIRSKPYLSPLVRGAISRFMAAFESIACRRLDCVVSATPAIRAKFERLGIRTIAVNNYPLLGELETNTPWVRKSKEVCYVGGVTAIRGIVALVEALGASTSGAHLNLVGAFSESDTYAAATAKPGWGKVNELGFLGREKVRDVMARSMAGIVTFLPEPNHIEALPNKMFEYMSAGLPIIASDFPGWRQIVEDNECGICVDPQDVGAIAAAIDRLVEDPDFAKRLGENGRRAVNEHYNWNTEKEKLLELYAQLGCKPDSSDRNRARSG